MTSDMVAIPGSTPYILNSEYKTNELSCITCYQNGGTNCIDS
jgi:hypothetical protein